MKYGQKVRVTSGFYEGMEGTVIINLSKLFFEKQKYVVTVETIGIREVFPESSLELIK